MADKISSPSSSSNSGSNHTPPKKGPGSTRNDDDKYLVIRRQPPTHVFSGESFDVLVGLEVNRLTGDAVSEVELTAALQLHKDGKHSPSVSENAASVEVANERCTVAANNKPCRLECKIHMRETIRRDKPTSFLLTVLARDRGQGVASTTTIPILAVGYKLRIATDSNWSNIWYKDEGGRDKSMEVIAELYSKDNVQHRERIPLRLTLFYSPTGEGKNPVEVTNQEILRSLGNSSKLYTDKVTGKANVRFRIEDVSKNHQGQDFLLKIAPDYRKGFFDIAPGFTPSVSVRSKRNKRQRSSVVQSRADKRGSSPVQHSETTSGGRPFGGEQPPRSAWGAEGLPTSDPQRLREAMQGIVHWAEEVVNGLYPLQWQIIGYAQHPDGSPDYSRPHHTMNNPNPCISRVLAMYSESTRENLWVLSQAVEQAATAGSQMQASSNRDTYGRRSPDDAYAVPPGHRGPPQPATLPPARAAPGYTASQQPPPAMSQVSVPVQSGMHPSIASEAFRPKIGLGDHHHHPHHLPPPQQHHGLMPFTSPPGGGRAHAHPQHAMPAQQYYRRPIPTQARRLEEPESNLQPEPFPPPVIRGMPATSGPSQDTPSRLSQPGSFDHDESSSSDPQSRESEVEYVLAKEYKALRTGERLGFPAYSASREILGFYRESRTKVGVGEFIPISRHSQDFGPMEIMQASGILAEAIAKKSSSVHALKDWGSIANLIDHALVYDWTKDMGSAGGTGNSHSGSDGE